MKRSVLDTKTAVAITRSGRQRKTSGRCFEVRNSRLRDDAKTGDEVGDDFGASGRKIGVAI